MGKEWIVPCVCVLSLREVLFSFLQADSSDRYRHFNQLVPEFNKFLLDHAITSTGLDQQAGADLLGARFFGRWRSGKRVL